MRRIGETIQQDQARKKQIGQSEGVFYVEKVTVDLLITILIVTVFVLGFELQSNHFVDISLNLGYVSWHATLIF